MPSKVAADGCSTSLAAGRYAVGPDAYPQAVDNCWEHVDLLTASDALITDNGSIRAQEVPSGEPSPVPPPGSPARRWYMYTPPVLVGSDSLDRALLMAQSTRSSRSSRNHPRRPDAGGTPATNRYPLDLEARAPAC